jgi:hypothetical protein
VHPDFKTPKAAEVRNPQPYRPSQQYQPSPYYVDRASTDVMPNRERISSRKYRSCANWTTPTLSSSSTFPKPSSTTTSSWSYAQVVNCSIRLYA